VRALDEKFDVGGIKLNEPGDPNATEAVEVVNCRCTRIGVLPD